MKAVKSCRDGVIEELVESACRLGASDAAALSVSDISVEDALGVRISFKQVKAESQMREARCFSEFATIVAKVGRLTTF